MRSDWHLRVALNPIWLVSLQKDIDMHIRRMAWGAQRIMAIYKPRREAWHKSSLTAFRKKQLCKHLDLKFQAPRTLRQ